MNEPWVIQKIQEAQAGGNLVKKDPESAAITFCIGTAGESIPPEWGNITGDLNDQEDLAEALNQKIEKSSGSPDMKIGVDEGGIFVDVGGAA